MRYLKWTTAALCAASATLAPAQMYTFGTWDHQPASISNNGTVAGYDVAVEQYMTWTNGSGFQYIGGQIPGNGHGGWPAITPTTSHIAGSAINLSTSLSEMAVYNMGSGTWTLLGSLGSSSDASASSGWAISNDGNTIVGNAWVNAGTAHAVMSKNGVMTDLGTNFANRSSRADGVSGDGTVVGGWQEYEDGYWGGSVWVNGIQTLLTNSNGDPLGPASGVSNDGQWVVGEGGFYGNYSAYRWSSGSGIEELDNPFLVDEYGMRAISANHDGSIIVGYAQHQWDFWQPRKSWIWIEGQGTMTIEAYAASLGFYSGETLTLPLAISANGEWILGQGWDSTGTNFINWALHTNPVPEPATLGALALGAFALIRRKRSR